MWRHPDFQLLGSRRIRIHDDDLVLRLPTNQRLSPASMLRIFPLHTDTAQTRRRRLEVERAGVCLVDELRPGRVGIHSLSKSEISADRGILDTLEVVGAHGPGRVT